MQKRPYHPNRGSGKQIVAIPVHDSYPNHTIPGTSDVTRLSSLGATKLHPPVTAHPEVRSWIRKKRGPDRFWREAQDYITEHRHRSICRRCHFKRNHFDLIQ